MDNAKSKLIVLRNVKTPKTVKGYLRLLIAIAEDTVYDLKSVTEEEAHIIAGIRGDIQNSLGDEAAPLLQKYGLKYDG